MGHWPRSWSTFHIAILELYPIVVAVNLWGAQIANKCIIFHCDNEAVVFIINRQTSKDCILMPLVRNLVLCCMNFNILIQASHIPGLYNVTSDKLSRFQFKAARRATPILDSQGLLKKICLNSMTPNVLSQPLCQQLSGLWLIYLNQACCLQPYLQKFLLCPMSIT